MEQFTFSLFEHGSKFDKVKHVTML